MGLGRQQEWLLARVAAIAVACAIAPVVTIAPIARAAGSAATPPTLYARVLAVYQQDGSVPPCKFTSTELQSALKGIDTYGAQYFSDFATAVQDALAQRASGACTTSGQSFAGLAGRGIARPLLILPVTAATSAGPPLPIVLMAVALVLALIWGAVAWLWRARGWDPRGAAVWRHAWAEAGHRAGAVLLGLRDWRTRPPTQ